MVESQEKKLTQANTVQLFAYFKSTHIPMVKETIYDKLYGNMIVPCTLPIVGTGTAKTLDKGHECIIFL